MLFLLHKQPTLNCLPHVGKSLFPSPALRDAAGKCRNFSHYPAISTVFKNYIQGHVRIMPTITLVPICSQTGISQHHRARTPNQPSDVLAQGINPAPNRPRLSLERNILFFDDENFGSQPFFVQYSRLA